MSPAAAITAGLARAQRIALIAGGAGLLASMAGAIFARDAFAGSWLLAFVFWTGLGVGCLGFLILHHLVGGGWGFAGRRLFEAGALALAPMAVFFLPLLLNLEGVFPWARPEAAAGDHLLQHRRPYLAAPFFAVRAAIAFGVWLAIAVVLVRRTRAGEALEGGVEARRKIRKLCGPALVGVGLTVTMAAVDWVMSLETHWFSTVFGLYMLVGDLLGGLALVTIGVSLLKAKDGALGITTTHLHDLGNFLFAFTMLWAYLGFTQFLIIWYGNTAEDTAFFVRRTAGPWQAVSISLIALHFAVPFFLLLSRSAKRSAQALAAIASVVLAMRIVDHVWMIVPSLPSRGATAALLDLAAFAGMGGIWVAFFVRRLRRSGPIPEILPVLTAAEEAHGAH